MNTVFLKIVNMSITASWLILAVILVRFLLKKTPKWIACLLWALVAIRLVCPFSLESAFSLIPSSEPVNTTHFIVRPYIQSGIGIVDNAANGYLGDHYFEGVTVAPKDSPLNPINVISMLWIIGIAIMLLYALISYSRLKKSVGASVLVKDNIFACDQVKSPFILGIFKPVIYIPSSMKENALNYVIAHEAAHIRRRDHWSKPFGFLLLTIYWFNPLCWIGYILLCRDIEMACDEKVIRELNNSERASYSQILLDCSYSHKKISACPLAFGEVGIKERVKTVLNYKKPSFWIIIAAAVVCIVTAVCLMTNPLSDENEADIRYYLKLAAEGVETIEITTPTTSGGCVRADGKCFLLGEDVYLANLDNFENLYGVTIVAYGKNNAELFRLEYPQEDSASSFDASCRAAYEKDGWVVFSNHSNSYGSIFSNVLIFSQNKNIELQIENYDFSGEQPYITVQWKNNGKDSFSFGESYCVYRKTGEEWEKLSEPTVNLPLWILNPGKTKSLTYFLSMIDFSADGEYCIYLDSFEQSDYRINFSILNQMKDAEKSGKTPPPLILSGNGGSMAAAEGGFAWFYGSSATIADCLPINELPNLPLFSASPNTSSSQRSNAVHFQFGDGTQAYCPDRVEVICWKSSDLNGSYKKVNAQINGFDLLKGEYCYQITAFWGESYCDYGFIGKY